MRFLSRGGKRGINRVQAVSYGVSGGHFSASRDTTPLAGPAACGVGRG
jgi:hypothetical protein